MFFTVLVDIEIPYVKIHQNIGLNCALQEVRLPKKQNNIEIQAGIQFENNELQEVTLNNLANIVCLCNRPPCEELGKADKQIKLIKQLLENPMFYIL